MGTQLTRGQARGFVNVQRHGAQAVDGVCQTRPFFIGQFAGAQMALVDAANRAHHTNSQLGGAHFHGKHRHRQAFVQGHMLGNVDRKGGLAHGRPGRQHDQVAGLQTRGHAIQVVKASGDAGDVIGVVGHLLDPVHQLNDQGVHGLETLLIA